MPPILRLVAMIFLGILFGQVAIPDIANRLGFEDVLSTWGPIDPIIGATGGLAFELTLRRISTLHSPSNLRSLLVGIAVVGVLLGVVAYFAVESLAAQ